MSQQSTIFCCLTFPAAADRVTAEFLLCSHARQPAAVRPVTRSHWPRQHYMLLDIEILGLVLVVRMDNGTLYTKCSC